MKANHILLRIVIALAVLFAAASPAAAQKVQLGEVLVVNTPFVKPGIDAEAFEQDVLTRVMPAWKGLGKNTEAHFFRADRGKGAGRYWQVWSFRTAKARQASMPAIAGMGFSDSIRQKLGPATTLSPEYIAASGGYTDFELIGADKIKKLPQVELLGVHYIHIIPEKREDFERFVRDKLHPAVVNKIPGMDLLYYKGVRGELAGRYLLIFAIKTDADRARYWPTGSSETQTLKDEFAPLKDLAQELKTYEVEGTYLPESSGAAAQIFESLEWTDFAILK
ncbi:MAG: hypothetical protein R2834_14065 [Rhodothermales bacterium]